MDRMVGSFEAKTHLAALLDEVAQGAEILICKRGVPVARLVPPGPAAEVDVSEAIAALLEQRKGLRLAGLDWRELRDAGRR